MERQNWTVSYIVSKNKDHKLADGPVYKKGPAPKTNKKMPGKAPHLIDDDAMKVDFVEHDLKMAIQQARQKNGWTQTELAQRLVVKPDIVKAYENGTAIPDNAFIAKMERVLGEQLPRHRKH